MLAKFLYRAYAGFYLFRLWRTRHFTPAGTLVVAGIFLSGILGLNMLKTTVYQVTAFSFSLLVASMVLSLMPFKLKAIVNRRLPEYATAGEPMEYEIEITNLSSTNQKGLVLYEDIQDPRPGFEPLLSAREPFEHRRNAWDRKTLYYRWQWLIQKNRKARFNAVNLPDLPVNAVIRVPVKIIPHFRGKIQFTGATIARPDVLGIFNRLKRIQKFQQVLVLPRRYPVDPPILASSRKFHPGGINLASSIGNSDEFMSLRYYRPGDPLRNIHWKTFAKTSELVIKEFEDEYFVRYALVLDTFLTQEDEAVFEAVVSIASSYIAAFQNHDSILDLLFAGKRMYSFSSGRGLGRPERLLEVLACIEPCRDKSILDLVPVLKAGLGKISGSICIFSGWDQGHRKICQMFERAGVPAFIVVLAKEKDRSKMEEQIQKDISPATRIRVVHPDRIEQELGKR